MRAGDSTVDIGFTSRTHMPPSLQTDWLALLLHTFLFTFPFRCQHKRRGQLAWRKIFPLQNDEIAIMSKSSTGTYITALP